MGALFAGHPGPCRSDPARRGAATVGTILLIILIILLLGSLPTWPYSRGWGYRGSGVLGLVLVIFIILLLLGHVRW
jgi:hypothetical protein